MLCGEREYTGRVAKLEALAASVKHLMRYIILPADKYHVLELALMELDREAHEADPENDTDLELRVVQP